MKVKSLKIKGIRNIREISQYPTMSNHEIRKYSLIRSSRIDKLSDKKRNKMLEKYNIKTIVDFRNHVEVGEGKKCNFFDDVKYIHLPLLDYEYFGISHEKSMKSALFNQSKTINDDTFFKEYMPNMYKSIIFDEFSQKQLRLFFNILIERGENGILFHCTGGKDRTGIATLFILTILGVSKDIIIKDFCRSDIENRGYNFIRLIGTRLLPYKNFRKLLTLLLFAKKEYLEKTIEAIEEKYGTILNYLNEVIGINEEKYNAIRRIFLIQ